MNNKTEFKTVEDDVRPILKYNTAARCDDMVLYACYVYEKLEDKSGRWLERIFSDRRYRITNGIAPYETVSRVRRKLQETEENLRATKEQITERKELEKKYKAYAKGLLQ